ncbi:MAG: glycosyltransferase family 4 protein [Clostridia bacterium]|nr:glycosyltransferase family 4 protein [Clostridia bacterium]
MNILIYTHHYPSPKELGLVPDTKVVHYFARMLLEKGHRVQVVHVAYWAVKEISPARLRHIWPSCRSYTVEGVPVRLIRFQMLTPRRVYPEGFQARIINQQLRRMKKELGWRADKVFVHFPTVFAGLTEIFADTPATLGDFHNMDVMLLRERDSQGRILRFIRQLNTWGYRNRNVQEYLTQRCGGAPVPVYTGLDAALLGSPEQIARKKQRPFDTLHLLYAGQLIPLKNVDHLIQALAQLDFPVTLTIVGDGPERPRLEALAAGDARITFTGWLPRENVIDEMKKADAFVMVSSPETYGMVYLEAMAQGCIAVASRGEGFDGLIRDGENGYLALPGQVDELAQILRRLRSLPLPTRSALIDQAYALACAMTEDQTTEGFLQANSGAAQESAHSSAALQG